MCQLKVVIIILGIVFALGLILPLLGIRITGKQFIYNLSQMEYEEAYIIVESIVESHLLEEYRGYWPKEQIRQKLTRYLEDAEELSAWEKAIYELRTRIQTGIIKTLMIYNTVALIIILIWYEVWDAARQVKESEVT